MQSQDTTRVERICAQCGRAFHVPAYKVAEGKGICCSKPCSYARQRSRRSPEERRADLGHRFWAKVQKSDDLDGCWLWTGARHPFGYGTLNIGYQQGTINAHRFSFELHHRVLQPGEMVCHRCDNPPCCNPAHLFVGSQKDNMADASRKRRVRNGAQAHPELVTRGGLHAMTRLTEETVAEIRRRFAAGGIQQKDLAAEYGLSRGSLSDIIRGTTWRHVLGEPGTPEGPRHR